MSQSWLKVPISTLIESASIRSFQREEGPYSIGPSRGLLRDCDIFTNLRLKPYYLLGGGDRVVPVRGGVHALPHLLHPARLPGQGRGRQNIT